MAKSRGMKPEGLVPHPLFGDVVQSSGLNVPEDIVRTSYSGYHSETIFAESAIEADISRQNFSMSIKNYYVDMLKKCRSCHRNFIFFAREQQHLYEDLSFYIEWESDQCSECRISELQFKRKLRRYSERIGKKDLSDREFATLIGDAVELWNLGAIRDEQKLRRLRNQARKRIPGYAETNRINDVVDEIIAKRADH